MNDAMKYPKTVDDFMELYKIVDVDHRYSNGAEFVPIFRMKRWFEHTDYVEVIRCKDCHFYDNQNNGGLKGHGFCEIYRGFKTEGGFCDLGEREETEWQNL